MTYLNSQISSKRRLLFAIAWIAFLTFRGFLLFVALPHLHSASPTTYQADLFPDWYDLVAMNIVKGHGYRFFPDTTATMLRSPGFVLVLAAIFYFFGHSLTATRIFNFFFSALTGYLVYLLGKRVTGSGRLGIVAAGITLLHPALLVADSRGGIESLLTLSITTFVLLLYRALKSDKMRDYAFAGISFGVALLIRATAALYPPFLFLYLIGMRPTLARVRHAGLRFGVLAVMSALVLSPWIVRNYILSGDFVPAMTVGGKAAYDGYYIVTHWHSGREQHVLMDEADAEEIRIARQMGLRVKPVFFPQFYTIADEVKYYRHLGEIVAQRYLEHPGELLEAIAFNARGFWIQGRTAKATTLNAILVLPFLVVVIFGIYVGWRRSLVIGPIVLFVLAYFAAHLPILGQARYQVPLIPVLAVLASIPFGLVLGFASRPMPEEPRNDSVATPADTV